MLPPPPQGEPLSLELPSPSVAVPESLREPYDAALASQAGNVDAAMRELYADKEGANP